LSQICSLYGGRIAEEMTLGPDGVTTGASNDIQRASDIARSMVTKWGLSEELGPLMYDEAQEEVFLGRSAGTQSKSISAETAQKIDKEVRRISDECYARATVILTEHRDKLDAMAEALMTYETIDASQIDDIMAGREPGAPSNWSDDSSDGGDAGGGDAVSEPDTQSGAEAKAGDRDSSIGDPAGEH